MALRTEYAVSSSELLSLDSGAKELSFEGDSERERSEVAVGSLVSCRLACQFRNYIRKSLLMIQFKVWILCGSIIRRLCSS